jgi:hypothetical protein
VASAKSCDADQRLIPIRVLATIGAMSFLYAVLAWLVIAAVLVIGIVMATKGVLWCLIVGFTLFILAFAKWGCAVH